MSLLDWIFITGVSMTAIPIVSMLVLFFLSSYASPTAEFTAGATSLDGHRDELADIHASAMSAIPISEMDAIQV